MIAWLTAVTVASALPSATTRGPSSSTPRARSNTRFATTSSIIFSGMPQSFYARWRTGDIMSRCVNDINAVRLLLGRRAC